MNKTIRILFPILPCNIKEIYFKGHVHVAGDSTTVYITKYSGNKGLFHTIQQEDAIFGYLGYMPMKHKKQYHNFLILEKVTDSVTLLINKLVINGNQVGNLANCIIMLYNYDNIKDSQAISLTSNDYFSELVSLVQSKCESVTTSDASDSIHPSWVGSSMFLQHIYNYWRLMQWIISTIKRDKKVPIKQGNLLVAILMDLILGYIALQLLPKETKDISSTLMGVLERLIHLLYSLLKWLMGAPVGLKLNNAFNKMLGKYFSYHVQLWWLFLDVSGERLDVILRIYYYLGYLGFTFQTAIISDLICIATFHSYCIYVYAARLFNIQISGLIALLRLFVGRKYNPLRGGIDSCEYTNQELFVGTVAFTILLLLLPTTALYYIVFTGFRVVSLVVQYALAKLIYTIQTSSLYAMFLWLAHSPKVKGNILIEVLNEEDNAPLMLRIKLFNKSIPELVHLFQPPVDVPKQVEWTNLLSNVLIGKQIV